MKQVESKVLTKEDKEINKRFQTEAKFYRDCENEIDKLSTRQGETLINIRDLQLWKVLYKSMAEAVQLEFGLSWAECHKRIEDVAVINGLKTFPNGKVLLEELGVKRVHIRVLASSADDDESRLKVLEHIKANNIELSAKAVKEVSDEILPPKTVSDEEKAEKKRLELEERKRKAEEKRAAKAAEDERKRVVAEKKKADKEAAKQAKAEAKRKEAEAVREPGDDEAEPEHVPEPKIVDESPEGVERERLKSVHGEKLTKTHALINSAFDSLGPLVRSLDDANDNHKLTRHKEMIGHYGRVFADLETAKAAIGKYLSIWNNSK